MSNFLKIGDSVSPSRRAKYHWQAINYLCPVKNGVVTSLKRGLIQITDDHGNMFWFSSSFWQKKAVQ